MNDGIADKIRKLLVERGVSQYKLSKDTGISQGTISSWFAGHSTPKTDTLRKIAEYFEISVGYFMNGETNIFEPKNSCSYFPQPFVSLPIVGTVRAGYGGYAEEEYTSDYKEVTREQMRGYPLDEFRVLRVQGDSMYPDIREGDIVFVHLQPDVESGQLAVVLNGEGEATIKTVHKESGSVSLVPRNPEYPTKKLSAEEYTSGAYRIWGRVLESTRRY